MAKKLKYTDIAEPKVLDPLIRELEQVNKLLKTTEEGLKEMAKAAQKVAENTPFDNYENIKKVEKAINDTKRATQEVDKVEKERQRLLEKQSQLNEKRIKENFRLKEEIKETAKRLREEAKATVQQQNAYQKLSKATNEAQKEFKRLAAELGINSKEAQEAKKRFDDLNDELTEIDKAAKDGRRNVGRYRESFEELANSGGLLGNAIGGIRDAFTALATHPLIAVVTALAAGLGLLFKAFQKSEEGTKLLRKGAALLEAVFSVIVDLVNDATKAFLEFAEDPISGLESLGQAIIDNIVNRFEAALKMFELVGKAFKQLIDGDFEGLKKTGKAAADTFGTMITGVDDFTQSLNGLGDVISDTIDKVENTANAFLALEAAQRAVRTQNRELRVELAKVSRSVEELTALADDDGRSLEQQREAIRAAGEERAKQAEIQLKIARNNLRLLNQEVAIRRQNGEEIQDLLDERNEAEVTFLEQQTELALQRFENAARERLIILDIFDQELDDLIDFADNSKTIRERIAADETQNLEIRRQALQDIEADMAKSFDNQVKLFEQTVRDLQESRGEAADFELPIEDLLAIEDTTELNEAIKTLDLVERQRIRLLELIRDRRTAVQDITEANRDFNKAQQEQLEIEKDVERQVQTLMALKAEDANFEEELAKLTEQRVQDEIDALQKRLEVSKENSLERAQIEQRLNDLLIDQEKKRLEDEQKIRDEANKEELEKEKEAIKKREEIRKAGFETLNQLSENFSEKQLESIDKELEANEKRTEELRELAKQGVQDAQDNLALQEKRQAELERKREKEIQRAQRAQLALSAIETYTAKVQAGDENPLFSTIADVQLLRKFIESLPGFYKGTEMVSQDVPQSITGKDGHIIRVDGAERILSPIQNAMIPREMSNFELANLAKSHDRKATKPENDAVLRELRGLRHSIDNKPAYLGSDYDAINEAITTRISYKNKLEKRHFKVKKGVFKK